jgi:hypothetical protein
MAIPTVSEELCGAHPPVAARQAPSPPLPGRKRLDDRACLNGILLGLKTGIPWQDLPQQLGYGSGMTCWRRLRDWKHAGVWEQPPPAAAGPAPRGRAARLVPGSGGLLARAGAQQGEQDRRKAGRPRQSGQQAPPAHRWGRDPAGGPADRRQPQRRHPGSSPAKRRPAGTGPPWPLSAHARGGLGRSGRCPRQLSSAAAPAPDASGYAPSATPPLTSTAQVAPGGQPPVTGGSIRGWMGQVDDHGAGESDDGIKKVTQLRTTAEG